MRSERGSLSQIGKDDEEDQFGKVAASPETQFVSAVGIKKIEAPLFANLSELAVFVCESGYMVGNDSGIGHLASNFGLPTLTICRSYQNALFWRPAWTIGEVITPSPWIPNLKGLRWRDRHWKKWISVNKALKGFHRLEREVK